MRAIGYACLNTLSQKPKNLTLADQEQTIHGFVGDNGWELVDIYREMTSSNNAQNQPMLETIITKSGENKFDILVIARLDRLTRNIRVLNTLISEMCMRNNKINLNASPSRTLRRSHCIDYFRKFNVARRSLDKL